MEHTIKARYADVLEAAHLLAFEDPAKVTALKQTYWSAEGDPLDLVSATLDAVGFKPTKEWLKLHNHQHTMFWGNDAFSDWAVKVFIQRLQRSIDAGKPWYVAVRQAESQTKSYYRSPANRLMIQLMGQDSHYPDSTKPEDVLK